MVTHMVRYVFLLFPMMLWFADLSRAQTQITGDGKIGHEIVMQGIPSQGVAACMACHKENGEGNLAINSPQIAGLNAEYLAKQIKDYQSLTRINPIMQPIAKALKPQDIANVAAYFSSLPVNKKSESSTNTAKIDLGKSIAQNGLWNKGVPACFSCHGPNAIGVGENFPRLIFQGKKYISQQLHDWKKGLRKNDPNQLMKTVALKLTNQEIDAVSEYLGSLEIEKNTEVKK